MTDEERGQEMPRRTTNAGPFAEDEVTEWLGAGQASATPGPPSATRPPRPSSLRRMALAMVLVLVIGALAAATIRCLVRSPGRVGIARQQAEVRAAAAGWVVQQVRRDAGVACDPVMCAALRARGFPARNLFVLGPTSPNPVGSDVVVQTPAVLSLFGTSLATAWAPAVLASFGSGPDVVTVRVMAANGAAAYQTLLGIDLADRKSAGTGLLRDPQITMPAAVGAQLTAGAVDSRLLLALGALARHQPISIVRFGDAGPGASPGVPLRSVDLAEDVRAAHLAPAGYVKSVRAYLGTVDSKYRPASMTTVVLAGGHAVLRVEFTAPSPLGMFSAKPSSAG
jgi:hypothetical protein